MANIILPHFAQGQGASIIIDGVTYSVPLITSQGYPLTVPAWDSLVPQLYSAALANHADTVRFTYTVPAGRFAIVTNWFVEVQGTSSADQGIAFIETTDSGDTRTGFVALVRSLTTGYNSKEGSPHLILDDGDKLKGHTTNADSSARTFNLSAHIIEVIK